MQTTEREQGQVGVAVGRCPRCGAEHSADLMGAPHPEPEAEGGGEREYSLLRCHGCGTPYLRCGPSVIHD